MDDRSMGVLYFDSGVVVALPIDWLLVFGIMYEVDYSTKGSHDAAFQHLVVQNLTGECVVFASD